MNEDIAPDVAPLNKQPLSPGEAVALEEDEYGESSLDENREDQRDVHHGTPDDIV